MTQTKFSEYLAFLKDVLHHIEEYRTITGQFDPNIRKVQLDLSNEDPFVVLSASIVASIMLEDKTLYH